MMICCNVGKCMGSVVQSKQPRSWIPSGEKLQHREKHWPALPLGFHRGSKGPQGPQPRVLTCLLSLLLFTQCNEPASQWDNWSFANFVIKIGTESCQEVNGQIWNGRVKMLIKVTWFSTPICFPHCALGLWGFLCFKILPLNPIDRMSSHLAQRVGICWKS